MQTLKLLGKILKRIFLLAFAVLMLYLLAGIAAFFFHLDFDQSYRSIDNYEGIVLESHSGEDTFKIYTRDFTGVTHTATEAANPKKVWKYADDLYRWKKTEPFASTSKLLQERIGNNRMNVEDCVLSPDGKYILYAEKVTDGYTSDPPYADYYYRVLNLEDNTITTIYHGWCHAFTVDWRP